jgi:hypothetical protein
MNEPASGVITNRAALAGWIFMCLWLGMLGVFTYLFWRDGGMHRFSHDVEAAILGVFWIGGLAGSAHLFSFPLIRVERRGDTGAIRRRWLLRRDERRFPVAGLGEVRAEETTDSEGDPLYRCLVALPDGSEIAIRESGHEPTVREAQERCEEMFARQRTER